MSVRVVLADDHEIVIEGLRSVLLKEHDFEIVGEASHGKEALEMVLSLEPDVLVLDIAMPDMDGIDVARNLQKKGASTRILALSMHSEREFVKEMFTAGAKGYLLKESSLRELKRAIDIIMSGKKYLSEELVDVVLQDDDEKDPAEVYLAPLTKRERQIFELVVRGNTTKEIAFELGISPKTVDGHRAQISRKLDADSMLELVKIAVKAGLVTI